MRHLWAPWRMVYLGATKAPAGCVFCDALGGSDDRKNLVLARRDHAFLILNLFPYTAGHVMAVVNRHVGALTEVTASEMSDAMRLVNLAITALTAEYRAEGFNVGINQGRAAGAGIADHLHVHVVPRWNGDNNFMSVVGDTRVIPESPEATYDRLKGRLVG